MTARKRPLWVIWQEDSEHVSRIILRELELYAKDRGFYPSQHGLFGLMTKGGWNAITHEWEAPRHKFTQGQYDHWYERLVSEGYINIDTQTRATRSNYMEIVEKETRPPELED